MALSQRNRLLFFAVILISLLSCTSLFSTDKQITIRAEWTYTDGYDPHGGFLDWVTFVVYPSADEQLGLQALQANIIYAWDEHVRAENIAELENTLGVEVTTEPGDLYRILCFNCRRFPTNMTGYRRALAYALDKVDVVLGSTYGLAFLQDCAIPIVFGNWTYESQLIETYYTQNIVKANTSLEDSGFRDLNGDGWRDFDTNNNSIWDPGIDLDSWEFEVPFHHLMGHVPSENAVTLAVEGMLKCGIRVEIDPLDFYDLQEWSWPWDGWLTSFTFTNMVSPDLLFDLFHSSTDNNQWYFGGWTNSIYDEYAENLIAAQTEEEANHWAWKCQEVLWYEQPMVVCYNDVYTHAYRTDRWEGYVNMATRNRICNGYSLVHLRLKEDSGGPWGCIPTEYVMSLQEGLDTTNWLMSTSEHTDKVFQLVYEELWTLSPYDLSPQPALAYAWEIESTMASGDIQDGEKYTFHLYENATWHDGIAVTATDVAFSLSLGVYDPIDAENYQNVYMTNIIDSNTIEIYTNATGYFEWTRATDFTVYPAHIWSTPTNVSTWAPSVEDLVGSGPYIFSAHVPGQYIMLERHSDWHFAMDIPFRCPCGGCIDWRWEAIIVLCAIAVIIIQIIILTVLLCNRRKKYPLE